MKKMEIYEPAMCCTTGICGVSVDPELLRVAAVIDNLRKAGAKIKRYNLNSAPMKFIDNKKVNEYIQTKGAEGLPIDLVDGEIVLEQKYPSDEEFEDLLSLPRGLSKASKEKEEVIENPRTNC